ncbi:Nitrile-specifier protein 5 [Balamuthia mandrillaris]
MENSSQTWWRRLSSSDEQQEAWPKGRSSHAVAVVDDKLYVYGGEDVPRRAFDGKMHCFDLANSAWIDLETQGEVPEPRLAHSCVAVDQVLYIFGGRKTDKTELDELLTFDTRTNTWSKLASTSRTPAPRSYHCSVALGKDVYVFGGCGQSGRMNDLWRFDTANNVWEEVTLAPSSAPAPSPRGGPALCAAGNKIYLFGGFNGKELQDLYCFTPETKEWRAVELQGDVPAPRSVLGCCGLGRDGGGHTTHMFVFGGEAAPSAKGHEGAGLYFNDAFVMDVSTEQWHKVETEVESAPSARGWIASHPTRDGRSVVLFGGYDGEARLNDLCILSNIL